MQFIALTENNEHEGETWRFWLQLDGNETELEDLRAAIAGADQDETYDLDGVEDAIPESEVDVLVKHTRSGYMDYEQKYSGTLALPDEYELDDVLYKGTVEEYFTAAAEG